MFSKILIANRGEIACRIIKTCKQIGIKTVAVYSTIDRQSLFVEQADEAYCIGSSDLSDSYLNIQKIITIAVESKCQAIHPGYGFLSENADFAKQCKKNNLVFIGPSEQSIGLMGCKKAAKELMEKANVPVVPGFNIDTEDYSKLIQKAEQVGFPVLIKAASGGGGKGMKLVRNKERFIESLESAKREAKNSFGDETLIVEKYLSAPRHIEVQIFADNHGNIIHLFERDCSIQRRHQKIVEEAPAINIPANVRKALHQSAIDAAKAINYSGAGTIEFLLEDDAYYFMEMNTRLQVEHPVTELITNIDLVEWQIRVATGEKLPLTQSDIKLQGHAVEIRLYAEDPDKEFLPQTGMLDLCHWPQGPNIRIDSGVRQSDLISVYYDPMIAKVISWGRNRYAAIENLQRALNQTHLSGLTTNLSFLKVITNQPAFIEGKINTRYLEDNVIDYQTTTAEAGIYLATYLSLKDQRYDSPWLIKDAWQSNLKQHCQFQFNYNDEIINIGLTQTQSGVFESTDNSFSNFFAWISNGHLVIEHNNHKILVCIYKNGHAFEVICKDRQFLLKPHTNSFDSIDDKAGSLAAPMPGTVTSVSCKQNDVVNNNQLLMIIEAMKMEHRIEAPFSGKVESVFFKQGDQVDEGELLLALTPEQEG